MDPNACLRRWYVAVMEEDKAEANDAYFALCAWVERGGFEPSWGKGNPSRKQFFSQYNPRTGRLE